MKTALRAGIVGAAGLGVVALVALMSWSLSNKAPVTSMSGFTRVHQPAPEFVLPLFDGGELESADYLGKPMVINFWASWCAPCRDEADGLERTWRAHAEDGVLLVGVNIQDSEREALEYIGEFDVTYPNGPDSDGRITVDYGVVGLPVTFFVGRDGTVQGRWVGALPESRLLAWMAALTSEGPAVGDPEGENLDRFEKLR